VINRFFLIVSFASNQNKQNGRPKKIKKEAIKGVVIRLTEGELKSWKRLVSCAASMFQRWSGIVSSLAATQKP